MVAITKKKTKKEVKESLKKMRQEESDRVRNLEIENPHRDRIIQYFSQWQNEVEATNDLELPMSLISSTLRELEREGLVTSRDRELEWKTNREPWLSDDWFIEDKQTIEGFWLKIAVGRKLIKFKVWENEDYFEEYVRPDIWEFEISKRSLVSQIKKYNILPTEYACAYINTNLTPKLGMCIPSGDRCLFVDDKFKILQFDEKEIEKILNVDAEIKIKEFFLLKENELNLKRGDRVNITYYQLGIFETLPNEWEFLRFKGLYAEITRGDGCGDNYQKQPLWRIQKCSDTSNSSEELEDFQERSSNGSQTESEPPATSISTSQRSQSTPTISQASPSIGTSENFTQNGGNSTLLAADSHARVPATRDLEPDLTTQNQDSGEKDSELSAKLNLDTPLSSNLWELSTEDLERSLEDSEWQAIKQKLKLSQQADSERHISADDYLQLPTLTANNATANSRPAGRSKLEQKFVQLGLTPNGSKLSVPAMAMLMGYPSDWLEVLTLSKPSTQPASQKAKGGSKAESSSEKPSRPHKQGSHSQGCATSKGSQEDENILPTPAPIIEQRFEIELLSGEKVERGIGGLLNHLVEGAPLNQFEIGAIAYIEKQYRGELFEGKISRIFEKEYRDKVTPGDLVKIDDRHCDAGSIYEVSSTRGGYITTKEGLCFHPDRYEPFNPVGRKLKIDSQHPTLSDRIVEVESYKDGHVKIVGGGFVAIDMVSVTSDALSLPKSHQRCSELAEESPVEEQPTNDNQQPKGNILPAISAKAISLWQPWASLIGKKQKLYETRSWATDYRGKILICSAKRAKAEQLDKWIELSDRYDFKEEFKQLPLGYAIAIADLSDCILMDEEFIKMQSELERDCGDWQPERYAWKLDNIIPIDPQPIRGYQGLWNVDIAPYLPAKKKRCDPAEVSSAKERAPRKRGRKPGSRNKKAAKGHLYKRKDCNSYLYEYWDNDKKKKRCLSVSANLFPTIDKAIADGESVGKIIAKIKGTSQQLNLF